jgi:hypothetical protein
MAEAVEDQQEVVARTRAIVRVNSSHNVCQAITSFVEGISANFWPAVGHTVSDATKLSRGGVYRHMKALAIS